MLNSAPCLAVHVNVCSSSLLARAYGGAPTSETALQRIVEEVPQTQIHGGAVIATERISMARLKPSCVDALGRKDEIEFLQAAFIARV